jgi:hypothetical protein
MTRVFLWCAVVLAVSVPASAQTEDLEPRVIGTSGSMSLGLSGFIDRFMSSQDDFPLNATLHVDVARFVTGNIAVRGGLIGTAAFGGDDESDPPTGPGVAAIHAVGGAFFYFTPRSLVSPYAGAEYRGQLTRRAERDAGTLLGKGGIEAAVSSRVLVFIEGGYGARLTRGEDDEMQRRIVGEVGFRIRF